jgi:uncharacterized membrane protein YhfC
MKQESPGLENISILNFIILFTLSILVSISTNHPISLPLSHFLKFLIALSRLQILLGYNALFAILFSAILAIILITSCYRFVQSSSKTTTYDDAARGACTALQKCCIEGP